MSLARLRKVSKASSRQPSRRTEMSRPGPHPQETPLLRPPALSRPKGVVFHERPAVAEAPASKVGLWIALGFHACLIAAACTLTFTSTDEMPTVVKEKFIDRGNFAMPISSREPQKNSRDFPAKSTPPPAPLSLPLVALEQLTALRALPSFEPIAAITADSPAAIPPSTRPTQTGTRKRNGARSRARP